MSEVNALVVIEAFKRLRVPMLPESKTHRYRVEVESASSNKLYVVSQRKSTGQWECGCTGWIRWHKPCKHLSAFVPRFEAALASASATSTPVRRISAQGR